MSDVKEDLSDKYITLEGLEGVFDYEIVLKYDFELVLLLTN